MTLIKPVTPKKVTQEINKNLNPENTPGIEVISLNAFKESTRE